MKILITTEFYLPLRCGVTSAVLSEMKALMETGDEVRVLTIGANRKSFYDSTSSCWYIAQTLRQPYKDSYASLRVHDPIIRDVINWKPDIVHSQSEFFSFRFAFHIARKLSIPIVHTCHTDFVSYTSYFTRFWRLWNWAAKKIVPLLIRKADRVICSTEKIYSLISSYGIKQPVDRILVGIDTDLFFQRLVEEERSALRSSFGFSSSDIVLVTVSRLCREKNIGEIISFFSSLRRTYPAVKLLVVGDGDERRKLEDAAAGEGLGNNVFFTGEIDSAVIWKYYQCGDIYIGSSLSETECLSYVEAMASSLPLLVRYDEILSSYLVPSVNGFSYNTEEEFLSIASMLIGSPEKRKKTGEEAARSAEKFSLEVFASKLHSSFRRAAENV